MDILSCPDHVRQDNNSSSSIVYNVVFIPYMLLLLCVSFCTTPLVVLVAHCYTAAAVYRSSDLYQVYVYSAVV